MAANRTTDRSPMAKRVRLTLHTAGFWMMRMLLQVARTSRAMTDEERFAASASALLCRTVPGMQESGRAEPALINRPRLPDRI
jgi:hypothetical protein